MYNLTLDSVVCQLCEYLYLEIEEAYLQNWTAIGYLLFIIFRKQIGILSGNLIFMEQGLLFL